MESNDDSVDNSQLTHLHTTLDDGPPAPFFVLKDIVNRKEDQEVVINTTRMNVRIRTRGQGLSNSDDSTSEPAYPGLSINTRYVIF